MPDKDTIKAALQSVPDPLAATYEQGGIAPGLVQGTQTGDQLADNVVHPSTAAVAPEASRPVEEPAAPRPSLRDAAKMLREWLASLDPTWGERMAIMAAERGYTDEQIIGTLAAYPLDHALHMAINSHPAFEPNGAFSGPRNGACPVCNKVWDKKYPGQPVCSNECAAEYYAKRGAAA